MRLSEWWAQSAAGKHRARLWGAALTRGPMRGFHWFLCGLKENRATSNYFHSLKHIAYLATFTPSVHNRSVWKLPVQRVRLETMARTRLVWLGVSFLDGHAPITWLFRMKTKPGLPVTCFNMDMDVLDSYVSSGVLSPTEQTSELKVWDFEEAMDTKPIHALFSTTIVKFTVKGTKAWILSCATDFSLPRVRTDNGTVWHPCQPYLLTHNLVKLVHFKVNLSAL